MRTTATRISSLSICLSLSVCLPAINLPAICLPASLSACFSIYLLLRLPVCLFICFVSDPCLSVFICGLNKSSPQQIQRGLRRPPANQLPIARHVQFAVLGFHVARQRNEHCADGLLFSAAIRP